MSVERHLILQEITLLPAAEWSARSEGWLVLRVAQGAGYWLNSNTPREINGGDVLVVPRHSVGVLRTSSLGPMKLQFFVVQPRLLNGVLAMSDGQNLESVFASGSPQPMIWPAREALARRFADIAGQSARAGLSLRCQMLQLWADAIAGLLGASAQPASGHYLRDRFRALLADMSQAELSGCSIGELAVQLQCSERHLSRLFREEFGVPFRARQTELRLTRARQILADSNAKIINVAYESGYRHLGLFNSMFKKRFGMTPTEWRKKAKKGGKIVSLLFTLLFLTTATLQAEMILGTPVSDDAIARARQALHDKMASMNRQDRRAAAGQTNQPPADPSAPRFTVRNYEVDGNTLLSDDALEDVFADAKGTNVTFNSIRGALGDLQMAYRERGFVTASVALPQQKLTNGVVKVQVTEGRLAEINVIGNHWYSSNNVMRALPSLHTNMMLNSHVFQRELDTANASRDRQIYPIIGPGVEPGTSELTLKIKDTFPLHERVELNNQATPGTPELRVNSSVQYDNLWDREHQIGLQYNFDLPKFRGDDLYSASPLDSPLVANYSGYYRMPLGDYDSVQQQIDANPGSFGYSEVTRRFSLPPATGRPELNIYASRAINDTDVLRGPRGFLTDTTATNGAGDVYHPLSITTNIASQSITLNEDLGARFSIPLPAFGDITSTLSVGADYKHYRQAGFNTNENRIEIQYYDQQNQLQTEDAFAPQGMPPGYSSADYFPLNIGLNSSIPDKFGTTFFNATANFTPIAMSLHGMPLVTTNLTAVVSTDTNGVTTTNMVPVIKDRRTHYVTLQLGADRIQSLPKDWSLRLHADGQWADGPLFSNEQFAMGGVSGVRGYTDGEAYGDTGWRVSIEPRTPLLDVGTADFGGYKEKCWVRGLVFVDYGELYNFSQPVAGIHSRSQFCGAGFGATANIGSHLDARLTVAWPLISSQLTPAGDVHVYFGAGIQF